MKKPNHKEFFKRKVKNFELIDICPFDGRSTVIYSTYPSLPDDKPITSKFKGVKYFYDIRDMLIASSTSEAFRKSCQLVKYHKNLSLNICRK